MLIVQKYGGVTLGDATKVRQAAEKIAAQVQKGHRIVAVVSAMGSTTNELIALAHQVSPRPQLRELDMLLTTGERISMALLAMALHHLGIKATSLTGSQAGILTNDSFSNAFIQDVKAFRVEEALSKNDVVVLAGFQGVCPQTKEITTLGRGGTDTTAIAMSAYLKADHCEILKEVPAVFTADPRVIQEARPLMSLNYQQMADMTFWGAKVLHYRSIELALYQSVKVFVGPAHQAGEGTWISEAGGLMYEQLRVLSLNSHAQVLRLTRTGAPVGEALAGLEKIWEKAQVPLPQFLSVDVAGNGIEVWCTAPAEIINAIQNWLPAQNTWRLHEGGPWSSVTATLAGATSHELTRKMLAQLSAVDISPVSCRWSALSLSFFLKSSERESALKALHTFVPRA